MEFGWQTQEDGQKICHILSSDKREAIYLHGFIKPFSKIRGFVPHTLHCGENERQEVSTGHAPAHQATPILRSASLLLINCLYFHKKKNEKITEKNARTKKTDSYSVSTKSQEIFPACFERPI